MLTGNKGEWSETYVLIRLLADGKLHAADEHLNVIADLYFPIIKILRNELNKSREYRLDNNVCVCDEEGRVLLQRPVADFIEHAQILLNKLKVAKGASFRIPIVESFLQSIEVGSLTASSIDKSDINIVVHDLRTGFTPTLGFSIKSKLGKPSTLFNAGATTNFIYEITQSNRLNIDQINSIQSRPIISKRIAAIRSEGCDIVYSDIQSHSLKLNLELIDSSLPQILGHLVLRKYSQTGKASVKAAVDRLAEENPLHYDLTAGHPFYHYKVKNFLTDSALGMTPASMWTGEYDATGGFIIVKKDGDLVCYHIYNRNEFQNYLLNNTRFEQPGMGRYKFGSVYRENGICKLKLNLQIRFT